MTATPPRRTPTVPRPDGGRRKQDGAIQDGAIRDLVRYDWPRTLSITASAFLTLPMLRAAFAPA
jgi:hypothetical protein